MVSNTWTHIVLIALSIGATHAAAAQKPKPAQPVSGEWLAICAKCPSPDVTAKSGIGTAKATAEARMTRATITGPDGLCAANDNACIMTELKKVYRASADCTVGRITAVDEKTYTLAGLWDNSDVGGGRTKWKAADGQIVGRDNASGGLGISQQWEVLCPAPVSAALIARAAAPAAAPAAAQASSCAGQRYCDEVGSFAAAITDFRPSVYNQNVRLVSATVRFQNRTSRPLILGYVRNASVAIDEQGNRYTINDASNARGISEIAGGAFDPKFTLQPGQAADARFEFAWRWDGRAIIGQRAWDIDLTVREVNEIAPGQYRFGAEHALQFKGVSGPNVSTAAPAAAPGGTTMPTTAAAPASPAAAAPAQAPAPEADACGGKTGCYDAGPFVAELVQVRPSKVKATYEWHVVAMNIRFRNKTNAPIILAYPAGTGVLIDDLGNRYIPSGAPEDAKGIGKVQANSADPQFVLGPGQSRAATFSQSRALRGGGTGMVVGSKFTYDVPIAQLEVLYNGQQIRTVREHSLTFADFGLAGATGAATPEPTVEGITDAAKKLRGIFQRKPPGK